MTGSGLVNKFCKSVKSLSQRAHSHNASSPETRTIRTSYDSCRVLVTGVGVTGASCH